MENGYKALRINLEDIKKFLKEVGGLDKIDSIYMGLLINEKEEYAEKIGLLPKDKKYLTVQSNGDETIDKLKILFYRHGYNYGYNYKPIEYPLLTLILCKGSERELYFENDNNPTKIEVIEEAEQEKEKKISAPETVMEEVLAYFKRNSNNQSTETMYKKMMKKLEEEINRCPNQESQANYEK